MQRNKQYNSHADEQGTGIRKAGARTQGLNLAGVPGLQFERSLDSKGCIPGGTMQAVEGLGPVQGTEFRADLDLPPRHQHAARDKAQEIEPTCPRSAY